jgi:hypothetical protein
MLRVEEYVREDGTVPFKAATDSTRTPRRK